MFLTDIYKANRDDVLGLTFEVPEDPSFKGVVVANIAGGGLIARSKTVSYTHLTLPTILLV